MSRADVLMRKIREDIAIIENQKDANSEKEINIMESALIKLAGRITALDDLPQEEVLPHKDDLIGILGMMDSLTSKIEEAKTASREAVLDIIHKIRAQSSYSDASKEEE